MWYQGGPGRHSDKTKASVPEQRGSDIQDFIRAVAARESADPEVSVSVVCASATPGDKHMLTRRRG